MLPPTLAFKTKTKRFYQFVGPRIKITSRRLFPRATKFGVTYGHSILKEIICGGTCVLLLVRLWQEEFPPCCLFIGFDKCSSGSLAARRTKKWVSRAESRLNIKKPPVITSSFCNGDFGMVWTLLLFHNVSYI